MSGSFINLTAINELFNSPKTTKRSFKNNSDYYLGICPDMYFSEHLLSYLIQGAQSIKNEYFVLTPQICRMWDESWEIITHPKFATGPHYGWEHTTDIFDVDYHNKHYYRQIIDKRLYKQTLK